ncbi:MAG: radical SAM protein [Fretibacterium sp.]|nr:radical SAM protein [Fretibacterium sp.]
MYCVEAKSLLSKWNSINVYRGCTHGCIYCDSRSKCYGFTHEFEDIEVKRNAPELLERILRLKRKKFMVSTGSMSDPYMPLEEEFNLTRQCLEVIKKYGFGAAVLTKSNRILRDLDLLESINEQSKAVVQMTLTTCNDGLCRILEPNAARVAERIETLKTVHRHGIPAVVWFSPVLPFIEDTGENITELLEYCIDAGVKGIICFGMGMTLREGNREYYYAALDRHFPGLREKYEKTYGLSYHVVSSRNRELMELFHSRCEKYGIIHDVGQCFAYLQEFPEKYGQLSLF